MEHIQDILNDHESLRLLSLDHAASGRMAGLYRLPTSYNAKTQSYADVEFWHNDLLNPMDYLDCFPREQNPARRMRTRQNFAHKTKEIHGHYNLCRARERMLHQLFSMRTDCVGFRDLACFILANAYLSCNQSVEQTWSAVYRLNDSFSQPLPRHVLKAYLSTSMNKPYLLTNHKIIALLHITKKEQRMLGFYSVEEKKEQKRKRKRSKYLRNIKIAYYYLKGFTQIEIAHKVGCSQATVSRVLKSLSQIKNCVRMSADKFCRCMQLLWHRIHQTAMPAKLQFRELFSLFSHRGIFSLP